MNLIFCVVCWCWSVVHTIGLFLFLFNSAMFCYMYFVYISLFLRHYFHSFHFIHFFLWIQHIVCCVFFHFQSVSDYSTLCIDIVGSLSILLSDYDKNGNKIIFIFELCRYKHWSPPQILFGTTNLNFIFRNTFTMDSTRFKFITNLIYQQM